MKKKKFFILNSSICRKIGGGGGYVINIMGQARVELRLSSLFLYFKNLLK